MTQPPTNTPVVSVSELGASLRRAVETQFGSVRVRGEISRAKTVASGHCYLRLQDAGAVLDGVIWRSQLKKLDMQPEDGLEVVCSGRLTTYAGRSSYQIVIDGMTLAGAGALLQTIETRRRQLAAEGLFAAARKRPLPFLPEVIGVVTSPTGAVIRDILHRLDDRFPRHVLLWPARMQGREAAAEIAAAIAGFDALPADGPVPGPDVLIVARGGGSLEDLMPFNEEVVVRAAAACRIPLISAVGHETDTTLIDHAADRRAPTPSAAAEMAVPVRRDLLAGLAALQDRMAAAADRGLTDGRRALAGLARGLPQPARILEPAMQRLDDGAERLWRIDITGQRRVRLREMGLRLPDPGRYLELQRGQFALRLAGLDMARRRLAEWLGRSARDLPALAGRLNTAAARRLADPRRRLAATGELLASLSYQRVLERGFALVRDAAGAPLTRAARVRPGQPVSIQFGDGVAAAVLTGRSKPAAGADKTVPEPDREPVQGHLL